MNELSTLLSILLTQNAKKTDFTKTKTQINELHLKLQI